MKDVMIVTGAGQIGMTIARRMGYGMKIVVGDKKLENAQTIAKIMNDAGFDTEPVEMDLSSRQSIMNLIAKAGKAELLMSNKGAFITGSTFWLTAVQLPAIFTDADIYRFSENKSDSVDAVDTKAVLRV